MEIDRLEHNLPPQTACLVQNPINLRYLTGCTIDVGVLLADESSACFITDFRYIEVAESFFSGTSVSVVLQGKLKDDINGFLQRRGISKLMIEKDYQTVSALNRYQESCEIADMSADDIINSMRSEKLPYEQQSIIQAQKLTDEAFTHILDYIKPGITERDIALELEFYMRKNGAEGVSFDLIAVSGTNSSLPHGIPSEKKVSPGEFVTMDFGCKVNGYCSDMTRTVAVGYATDEMKSVYQTVLSAQLAALSTVSAGVKCSDVDKAARDLIYAAGYTGCFGHATGHGVGLFIHEQPSLSERSQATLHTGNVVTVEPGIYLPGKFGVRIEDMVIVCEDGCKDLTRSDKQLIIL